MYLKFEEIILVANKQKVDPEDPIIYVREYDGHRILTLNTEPHARLGEAIRYGQIYYDAKERPCVVPDTWTWDDAHLCKDSIPPEDPLEGVMS